jgi:hypothetical protein
MSWPHCSSSAASLSAGRWPRWARWRCWALPEQQPSLYPRPPGHGDPTAVLADGWARCAHPACRNSARASEAWDAGWIAGALPAAVSAGALAGNAAYGVRAWPMPIRHQLPLAAVAFTAGWLPLLAAHHPLTATGAALLAGIALGPLLLASFSAIDLLTPADMRTEGYGLLICAMGGGTALGSYIAGHAGTWPLAIVPLLAAALAAVLATSVRRPLRHARSTPSLIVLRGGKAASDPRDRSPYTSTTPAGETNDHK